MSRVFTRGAFPYALFYFVYFLSTGVTLPFMPATLSARGLTGTEIGTLLAVGPLFALLMPPFWGQLADAWETKGRVLALVCFGSALGLFALLQTHTYWPTLLALVLMAIFQTAISSLIDSVAMAHAVKAKISWPSLRSFGSAGFVLASLSFGYFFGGNARIGIIWPMLCTLLAGIVALIFMVEKSALRSEKPSFDAVKSLVQKSEVKWFLLATCLHWIACAPWHGILALHMSAMNQPPVMVGMAHVVAVLSEFIAMATWQRFGSRFKLLRVLSVVFLVSAVRWFLVGMLPFGLVPVLTAPLHGFTFGTFYVCAVSFMTDESPGHLKSTGQSLFVAATFGLGGMAGFIGSGRLYDAMGGHHLFLVASVVQLLPLIPMMMISRARSVAEAVRT
jgi:MFS transporter, PPP family, 3-phenylpropionic acid transporter